MRIIQVCISEAKRIINNDNTITEEGDTEATLQGLE